MLAAPIPTISWSGSTSSPRRAAKLVAVAIVSVRDTRVIPKAATNSGTTSLASVQGMLGLGTPCGNAPTVATPSAERSRTADSAVAPTTATRMAGTRVVIRGSTSSAASTPSPTRSAVVFVWSNPSTKALDLVEEAVGIGGEAEQLRQLADDDRHRQAVHVADLHLLREQVRHETELPETESDLDDSHRARQAFRRGRSPCRDPRPSQERHDGGEDQRGDRRVRAQHQHPRRPEDRVADRQAIVV